MRKIILIIFALFVFSVGYGQVTDVAEFRIANATTAFGRNLPVGTKIYNIATGDYWVVTSGCASTLTITTGSANLVKLNAKEVVNEAVSASYNGKTTEAMSKDNFHDYTVIGDTDLDGKINVLDVGAGLVKTDANGVVSAAVANTDYDASITNEAQTLSAGGTTSPTVSLNAVNGAGGGTVTFSSSGIVTLNQSGGTITVGATETDGSVTNEGVLGVAAGAANTSVITSNTSGSNGVTISGGNGVSITETTNTNGGTITISASGGTPITEAFEEDDETPTAHTLAHTAIIGNGARVSLNGATLKPDKYTLTTTTLTLAISVMQYDQIVISYTY